MCLIALLSSIGIIFDSRKFRYEGDQIYAFKVMQHRFYCFFAKGSKIIISNAYIKKTMKGVTREKEKALSARKCYINRCNQGRYYA